MLRFPTFTGSVDDVVLTGSTQGPDGIEFIFSDPRSFQVKTTRRWSASIEKHDDLRKRWPKLPVPQKNSLSGSRRLIADIAPDLVNPLTATSAPISTGTSVNAPTLPKPSPSERRSASLLKELKLSDADKEARTRAILQSHFAAMEKWHAANDPALTPLWFEWAAQRTPPNKDEAAAAKVGDKIDAIYASFRPQRDAFLAALAQEITPADVEEIKNSLTRSPGMDRTANAYIEMVPQFTDADKAFVRERFAIAREQAIDTTTGKEIEAFFKRQKVIVEAYIDEKGYDYRKSRAAWVAKMNAANAAAKAERAEATKE
jgi:hypothetical protein